MKNRREIRGVMRLLRMQLAISGLVSLMLLLTYGKKEGISAMLAAIVAIMPSALFAKKLFQYQGREQHGKS